MLATVLWDKYSGGREKMKKHELVWQWKDEKRRQVVWKAVQGGVGRVDGVGNFCVYHWLKDGHLPEEQPLATGL